MSEIRSLECLLVYMTLVQARLPGPGVEDGAGVGGVAVGWVPACGDTPGTR